MSNRHKEVIQITPTNLGNGVFSFANGTPQIEFDVPMMPKYMDGGSVRINGTLKVKLSNDAFPLNSNPADLANVGWIDPRTGIQSLFDYVSIANQEGQTYEMIKNYNRLCASIAPKTNSLKSYLEGGANITGCANTKDAQQGRMCERSVNFSVKLNAGFLNGATPIDLQLVRGLHITIQLAPNNYAIQNGFWLNPASATVGQTYELTDLQLTFDALVPSPEEQDAMMVNQNGSWDYNSFSSFYSVLVSNDHNSVMNINTGRTIAITGNMIPSLFLNNNNYDSQMCLQTLALDDNATEKRLRVRVPINEITFLKGGLRVPLDFEVDSEKSQNLQTADSQREYVALNSINRVWDASNFLMNLRTQLSLDRTVSPTPNGRYQTSIELNDAIPSYHFGVNYDHLTENGLNFKGSPLGLRIQSDLVSNEPHSVFIFVKHKNTINFQNGSVMVIS